jgi:sensor domain CHASE-containing protein
MSTRWQRIGENLIALSIASGVAAIACAVSAYRSRWRKQQFVDEERSEMLMRVEMLKQSLAKDQQQIDRVQKPIDA